MNPASYFAAAQALALVLLVGACGAPLEHADEAAADSAAEAPRPYDPSHDSPPSGEILLAQPPQGWLETGAMQTPTLRMAEYGPPGDVAMLERLTLEAQSGQPLPDPIEFVLAVSRDLAVRCNGFEDINIASGLENGYPASVRLMICPEFKDSPHGQVVMAKAIQGDEQFYVITRRLRTAPMADTGQPLTAQEMAAWTTHLKGIEVCDTRDTSHPCPDEVVSNVLNREP